MQFLFLLFSSYTVICALSTKKYGLSSGYLRSKIASPVPLPPASPPSPPTLNLPVKNTSTFSDSLAIKKKYGLSAGYKPTGRQNPRPEPSVAFATVSIPVAAPVFTPAPTPASTPAAAAVAVAAATITSPMTSNKPIDDNIVNSKSNSEIKEKESIVSMNGKVEVVEVPSLDQLKTLLDEQENNEVAKTIGMGITKSTLGLLKATFSLLTTSVKFLDSTEAKASSNSISSATNAAKDIVENTKQLFQSSTTAWKQSIGEEPLESDDTIKYFGKIFKGIKDIIQSTEVKASLSNITDNTKIVGKETFNSISTSTKKINKDLDNDLTFNDAISSTRNGLMIIAAGLTVFSKRAFEQSNNNNKALPF